MCLTPGSRDVLWVGLQCGTLRCGERLGGSDVSDLAGLSSAAHTTLRAALAVPLHRPCTLWSDQGLRTPLGTHQLEWLDPRASGHTRDNVSMVLYLQPDVSMWATSTGQLCHLWKVIVSTIVNVYWVIALCQALNCVLSLCCKVVFSTT